MKRNSIRQGVLLLSLSLALGACSSQKQTAKWFKSGTWYNGMKAGPHQTIDRKEFERQYAMNKAWWDKAFAFLKNTNLDSIAPGRYPVDGDNVYVNVTVSPMRDFDKTKWESHKKLIDLQYTYKGKEKMGIVPVSKAKVLVPYNPAKDVANYEAEGKYYVAGPGTFYLFFPSDAHRPNIKMDDDPAVKKIVVKIRYTE
ncbi:YhcH/YjgK/YiaL family protein [Arcticibacter sp. MXS-1]|uniref:YhcH/YjgK/YiaL family protein n=1 Tax=Arcticibacter sp. MXS-1 TaxID=3341726 RepID=UPI0035A99DE5